MSLLGRLAYAMGKGATKFKGIAIPVLLTLLSEKKSTGMEKTDAMMALEKWSDAIGHEHVVGLAKETLAEVNPELRIELLG